jgi:hypothetical protein
MTAIYEMASRHGQPAKTTRTTTTTCSTGCSPVSTSRNGGVPDNADSDGATTNNQQQYKIIGGIMAADELVSPSTPSGYALAHQQLVHHKTEQVRSRRHALAVRRLDQRHALAKMALFAGAAAAGMWLWSASASASAPSAEDEHEDKPAAVLAACEGLGSCKLPWAPRHRLAPQVVNGNGLLTNICYFV